MKFVSFPEIKLFNNAIRTVRQRHDYHGKDENGDPIYLHKTQYPKIEYKGTVKLHGTNAGIIFETPEVFHCQSRERIITPQDDNAGFAAFVAALPKEVISLISNTNIGIFGEWCGGSIQKGVSLNQLPKMFVIFEVRLLEESEEDFISIYKILWGKVHVGEQLKILNEHKIYFIDQFPTFNITVDFEHPEESQNELIRITEEVEKCCPVGKYFGVEGVGEGVVWKPVSTIKYSNSGYWHKVKGEKHQTSKIKKLAPIDVEVVNQINEIVDIVVTDNRIEQGITKLQEMGKEVSPKSTGDFLKWITGDIEKEDKELLDKSGIERKKIYAKVVDKARREFFNKISILVN